MLHRTPLPSQHDNQVDKMNSSRYLESGTNFKWESETCMLMRMMFAVTGGMIASLFGDWFFLFIAIGTYCLIEAMIIFCLIKRSEIRKIKAEYEESVDGLAVSNNHYAYSVALVSLYLSFTIISFFASLAKAITEGVLYLM